METEHIYVDKSESSIAKVLEQAEYFASEQGLSVKNTRRLRLIAEELLGMVSGITGDYKAMFWVSGDDSKCELHLMAKTNMTGAKRNELLSTATNGKNSAAVGIGGKLRNLLEAGIYHFNDTMLLAEEYGESVAVFYDYGMAGMAGQASMMTWTLSNYRSAINQQYQENEEDADTAWDELEKSVIANLADDVHVGIRSDNVEIVVYKSY